MIDPAVLKYKWKINDYKVKYQVYADENAPHPDTVPDHPVAENFRSEACFRELLCQLSEGGFNRVAYLPDLKRTKILTSAQREVWIEISKRFCLLPLYIDSKQTVFVFDAAIPPSLLYLYLCQIRYMEEFPDLVRIALYLLEQEVNIYLAIAMATKIACCNVGHSYLDDGDWYASRGEAVSIKLNLAIPVALGLFLLCPQKYDEGLATKSRGHIGSSRSISPLVNKLPKVYITLADLQSARVRSIMSSKTIETAQKRLSAFKAEREKK